jgi:adenosylcobyric acid synthase
MADLVHLERTGMGEAIRQRRSAGAAVVGVCGGYQMLGQSITDPAGVEGEGAVPGLNLLPASTIFGPEKITQRRAGVALRGPGMLALADGAEVSGYEIRMGRVEGRGRPVLQFDGVTEGCLSDDGWVLGTSVHGAFLNPGFRRAILRSLAARKGMELPGADAPEDDPFDRLADALGAALDQPALDAIIWGTAKELRR